MVLPPIAVERDLARCNAPAPPELLEFCASSRREPLASSPSNSDGLKPPSSRFDVVPTRNRPLLSTRTRSLPAVEIATVSAAGQKIPLSLVPVPLTIAGAAAVPADTVMTPFTWSVEAGDAVLTPSFPPLFM